MQKLRRIEVRAGAKHLPRNHTGPRITPLPAQREAERQIQAQAEHAYRRLIADWKATKPPEDKTAPQRPSDRPSKGDLAQEAEQSS